MATAIIVSESLLEIEEIWLPVALEVEPLEKYEIEINRSDIEKSSYRIGRKRTKSDVYGLHNGSSPKRLVKDKSESANAKSDGITKKIFEFVIQKLRNWPEERIREMSGRGNVMWKLFELAREEGLFESISVQTFESRIRNNVKKKYLLGQFVDKLEDKRLILNNLFKLGIGGYLKEKFDVDGAKQIFQFLIRKLRNWPEERIEGMPGKGRTLIKLFVLAEEEGLFESLSALAFESRIRQVVAKRRLLDKVVHDEEDKKLILRNLLKLGIGGNKRQICHHQHGGNKICQFLIRLLRNWPEEKLREMNGPVLHKILALAKEEGLFESYSDGSFASRVRQIVKEKTILNRFVNSEEDRRLILGNLSKLGIGIGLGGKLDKHKYLEICQCLIKLLRNWPEETVQQMCGRHLFKISEIFKKAGSCMHLSNGAIESRIRKLVLNKALLDQLVDNEEDKRLILDNLSKLVFRKRVPNYIKTTDDKLLSNICQFLIRVFRDWPEKQFEPMCGTTLDKIRKLGNKEGQFKILSLASFRRRLYCDILKKQRLADLVDNEEDRKLILTNLHKLGVGVKSYNAKPICADKPMEWESRDLSPSNVEPTSSSENDCTDIRINDLIDTANKPKIDFISSNLVAAFNKID